MTRALFTPSELEQRFATPADWEELPLPSRKTLEAAPNKGTTKEAIADRQRRRRAGRGRLRRHLAVEVGQLLAENPNEQQCRAIVAALLKADAINPHEAGLVEAPPAGNSRAWLMCLALNMLEQAPGLAAIEGWISKGDVRDIETCVEAARLRFDLPRTMDVARERASEAFAMQARWPALSTIQHAPKAGLAGHARMRPLASAQQAWQTVRRLLIDPQRELRRSPDALLAKDKNILVIRVTPEAFVDVVKPLPTLVYGIFKPRKSMGGPAVIAVGIRLQGDGFTMPLAFVCSYTETDAAHAEDILKAMKLSATDPLTEPECTTGGFVDAIHLRLGELAQRNPGRVLTDLHLVRKYSPLLGSAIVTEHIVPLPAAEIIVEACEHENMLWYPMASDTALVLECATCGQGPFDAVALPYVDSAFFDEIRNHLGYRNYSDEQMVQLHTKALAALQMSDIAHGRAPQHTTADYQSTDGFTVVNLRQRRLQAIEDQKLRVETEAAEQATEAGPARRPRSRLRA